MISFLVFFLYVLGHLFVIDRSSCVCRHLNFRSTAVSRNQAFIGAASIAIWNKNKIVMSMAIGTWGINVALLIQGKWLLPLSLVGARTHQAVV
jgi:hypothetical protein